MQKPHTHEKIDSVRKTHKSIFDATDSPDIKSARWWNETKRMIDRGYARMARKYGWTVSKNPQF